MSKKEYKPTVSFYPIVDSGNGYYVLVSHMELDGLIAKLMHVAELNSDKEYRDALKGELKSRCRNWLDNLYEESGYSSWALSPNADVHKITPQLRRER